MSGMPARSRFLLALSLVLSVAGPGMTLPQTPTPARKASPAGDRTPPARFSDPDRANKLARAFPELDKAFLTFAQASKVPGVAWGVIIDGALVHAGATGVRDIESNAKAMPDSVF